MKNGEAATFQDNSAHGEDAFVTVEIGEDSVLDAVMDGVSQLEGAYASTFTQQTLETARINGLDDVITALEQVNSLLFQGGRGRNLLTTISATLKQRDRLHVLSLGDSPMFLVRGGEITELNTIVKSTLISSLSGGALGQKEKLELQRNETILEPGDRLVLTTDGLVHNIWPEEIAQLVNEASSAQEAIDSLKALVGEKRSANRGREDAYGTFREDDQTAIIRFFD